MNRLLEKICELSCELGEVRIMEVCGTHTHEISRLGIRQAVPENIKFISGPGCPVCVTAEADIFTALSVAKRNNVILCTYGDMLRVPCNGESLYDLKGSGCDIRIVISTLDVLKIAEENPLSEVVFFAVGFETGTANTAALVLKAREASLKNISVICAHKTMPQALKLLLGNNKSIDALLCPGHVAAVTGSNAFGFIPEQFNIPAVISGFGAREILTATLEILSMLVSGKNALVNAYPSAVTERGNIAAKQTADRVFEPCDALWRGLGTIKNSGLKIGNDFSDFDALNRFSVEGFVPESPKGCICSLILKGESDPTDCPCFGKSCTPLNPVGPCMVSSEGSCSAYYKYGRN